MNCKAYKFRMYPNQDHISYFYKQFGAGRFVYNWALSLRSKEWKENKKRISWQDLNTTLTKLKKDKEYSWLNESNARGLGYSLRNLETAYQRFFAKKSKYPKFKKRKDTGGSCHMDSTMFKIKNNQLFLPKHKTPIKVSWSRKLPSPPKLATFSQDSTGKWWVSFMCEVEENLLPKVDKNIGIDLGLTAFATTSNGTKFLLPKTIKQGRKKLEKAQRKVSKKKKGSSNRRKAKLKLAKLNQRISNIRNNFLHQTSRQIVNENQVIAMEDLHIKGMMKNHCLARSIGEQGWYEFTRQLRYKSEWAGRTFVQVDRFFPSSKTCSSCSHIVEKLPLNIRQWECPSCKTIHDRDVNAAINILSAGLAVTAYGVDGRPLLDSSEGVQRRSRKSGKAKV